jgi:hypothetical protein
MTIEGRLLSVIYPLWHDIGILIQIYEMLKLNDFILNEL